MMTRLTLQLQLELCCQRSLPYCATSGILDRQFQSWAISKGVVGDSIAELIECRRGGIIVARNAVRFLGRRDFN